MRRRIKIECKGEGVMRGRRLGVMLFIILVTLLTGCGKKKIDVTENLQVSFEGYNGYGKAELLNAYAWEAQAFETAGIESVDDFGSLGNALNIEMAVSYVVEPSSNLSNGDTVIVKTVIDEVALEDYDFELVSGGEKTFIVADLPELQEIDPFEDIEIMYEGTSLDARATVIQKGTAEYPMDFYYQVNPQSELKNGDKIIVSISGSNTENEAAKEGYRLTSLEKEFTVSGLSQYVESLSEIPNDVIEKLRKHTDDMIEAERAKDNDRLLRSGAESLVYNIKNKDFLGNYFLCKKSKDALLDRNYCYFVYKIDMTGKEDFSYYYAVGYYGILITEDGNCSYDFDNYKTCGGTVSKGFAMFSGRESLDDVFNACVTKNLDRFTYESTVVEK
mgnify:CR=1 FL=1